MTDIQMKVNNVLFDPQAGASVVMLKEKNGERVLPMWVGQSEALSIAFAVEKVELERPITHVLLKTVFDKLVINVTYVRVRDLVDGTFFALMKLVTKSGELEIDCRPSDAIAIALRCNAPIFVDEAVLKAALGKPSIEPPIPDSVDEDYLANLPEDKFGKYKM